MLRIGIDYSITSPAICCYTGTENNPPPSDCQFFYLTKTQKYMGKWNNFTGIPYPDYGHHMERYNAVAFALIDAMRSCRTAWDELPEVWIEAYGFNANGRITDLAEHTGVLKQHLWKMDIPYTSVSIGSVKKRLTGKGNASKEEIGKIWKKEIPTGFPVGKSPMSDCLDAYGVLLVGMSS